MARTSTTYACRDCGATTLRWVGRCPKCQAFGSVDAVAPTVPGRSASAVARPARSVASLGSDETPRQSSGLAEFDRVIGGGLVGGQVILLAGEPGVGKSTLALTVADRFARQGLGVLYVSGEESSAQIGVRARRIGATEPGLMVADETDLRVLLGHVEQHSPALLVVDSVQTLQATDVDGRAGGVAQVLEVTQALTRLAKSRGMPVIAIGQSTKENSIAGPRAMEHLVDTVLTFDGDPQTSLRILRSTKNRYGSAEEVACFEQVESGLREVVDPSELFRSHRDEPVPGTCVTVSLTGRRPMLVEVQALVSPSSQANPRRMVTGMDTSRVTMLVAVTERNARLRLRDHDVYSATVGGARIADPATDLAVCLSIASAAADLPTDVLAIGEVALSGDIRPVRSAGPRIAEAIRLGYRRILVPPGSADLAPTGHGSSVIEVDHLTQALLMIGGTGSPHAPAPD